ncbi:DUF998 domain-containing protein [Amycolatopsis sp. FBCC-B4732]|uniref:DUF998 domain-containing protein n=1 Tax=Amycolatopsis sp. FBCC-B4732 TaxID=3079339 RepID=UPI001FF59ED4|nr:DUF998 domain-containing protein [Amycolatopsis sp. FBCC-B4732]UOX88918.1 DUF998 domain-containing protein [Amycolatopsis sp. FBCC-B4732]
MTTTTLPTRVSAPTRTLLTCGILAGPVFVGTAVLQGLTRAGFDFTRHPASILANGSLGFVQVANFLVTGLLTLAAAAGLRRVLPGRWGPRLLAVYGVSLICAGVFRADPQDGFPLGTPAGPPSSVSWHGALHFACGGVGFAALVAACFAIGAHLPTARAWYSRITGLLFLVGFGGVASGSASPAVTLGFWAAVVLAWAWLATTSAHLMPRGESR